MTGRGHRLRDSLLTVLFAGERAGYGCAPEGLWAIRQNDQGSHHPGAGVLPSVTAYRTMMTLLLGIQDRGSFAALEVTVE